MGSLVTPDAGIFELVFSQVGLAASITPNGRAVPKGASKIAVMVDNGDDGTTTVDIDIEWSPDNVTWFDASPSLDEIVQLVADEKVVEVFDVKGAYWRPEITIGGGGADTDLVIYVVGIV